MIAGFRGFLWPGGQRVLQPGQSGQSWWQGVPRRPPFVVPCSRFATHVSVRHMPLFPSNPLLGTKTLVAYLLRGRGYPATCIQPMRALTQGLPVCRPPHPQQCLAEYAGQQDARVQATTSFFPQQSLADCINGTLLGQGAGGQPKGARVATHLTTRLDWRQDIICIFLLAGGFAPPPPTPALFSKDTLFSKGSPDPPFS